MSSRISALKNKIMRLQSSLSFNTSLKKDKEIIFLKQEGQCKQVSIDSLEFLLDNANQELAKLDQHIKSLEEKKIKNKIKKLFNS
ncbi:MAG: hypothetical protein ACREV6_19640 [Clostridium sp.]|uniref:hypothetical protein n=1 Tax=Clostridium sp. TaxID=1506 RepID=UPI003D6C7741